MNTQTKAKKIIASAVVATSLLATNQVRAGGGPVQGNAPDNSSTLALASVASGALLAGAKKLRRK